MFEKLPYHIVVQILRNLPPVDLKNVMTLNSEFFEIISTSSSLNRTLKLSLTEHKLGESQEVAQAILNGNRTYESIDINSGGIPKCRKLYSEFVADFMKMKGKHVKVFSHSGKTTVEYFLFLLNFMPNIETLNAINPLNPLIMGSMLSNFSLIGLKFLNLKLEDSNRSDFLEFCQKFISLQRNLKELTLEGNIFQIDLSSTCSFQLTKLHLNCKKGFDNQEMFNLLKFLRSQQKLQELNLHLHSKLPEFERATLDIINKLPSLKKLNFDTSNLTATMLNKNTVLQSLHLAYN